MSNPTRVPSARREELLEHTYRYALEHGIDGLSLRPLAAAIGSSPRVLLFLFGSKDGLLRALLAKARAEELALLARTRMYEPDAGLAAAARTTWAWLAADAHRPLLRLWVQAYARSLVEPDGPWAGFARQTVADWLDVLAAAQPAATRRSAEALVERTLALAVLRGALLDLLATDEIDRIDAAVERHLNPKPA